MFIDLSEAHVIVKANLYIQTLLRVNRGFMSWNSKITAHVIVLKLRVNTLIFENALCNLKYDVTFIIGRRGQTRLDLGFETSHKSCLSQRS